MSQPNQQEQTSARNALIVIPDSTIADILLKALKIADFRSVFLADSSEQALNELDWCSEPIDLVAMGLRLSDGDGFQLIEKLASRNFRGDLLFISDSPPALLDAAVDLARQRGMGVVGSFEEPFSLRALLRSLAERPGGTVSEVDSNVDAEELEKEIHDWRIEAVYQPKICLRGGGFLGFEALARWNHPRHGLLPPSYFLSRAEQDSLIDDLTEEVLRQSALVLQECRQQHPEATMSINLSGISLGRRDLPDRMLAIIREMGLAPADVIFEVTETQMLRDVSHALLNVDRLGLMGFGLSLDDYGSGFSSLSRLKQLPFTEIKVDRRFVHGAAQRESLAHILRSCASLARDLDLQIIAEGVETRGDWELVRSLGFDGLQGYYESPPLRARELIEWLDTRYGEEAENNRRSA